MRRFFFFIFSLMCLANIAGAQYIMTIGVNESGNSQWILEKRLVLTKTEIKEWEGILNSSQNMSRYSDIVELNEIVNRFNASAQNFTNRSTEVEEFNISRIFYDTEKTASNSFGIIGYRFEWKNFSRTDSGKIYVGDVFSNDMLLSSGNVLIIEIPEGYKVLNSSPIYDRQESNRLIWEGKIYRNFTRGEPALILSRINLSNMTYAGNTNGIAIPHMISLPFILISIIGLVTFSTAGVVFLNRRNSEKFKRTLNIDLIRAPEMLENLLKIPDIRASVMQIFHKESITKSVNQLENDVQVLNDDSTFEEDGNGLIEPMLIKEILSYEEMIEQYLVKKGGQAFQTNIVKELGLSKSKISNLLADMKENGRIIKIKRGKENIIRIVKSQAM